MVKFCNVTWIIISDIFLFSCIIELQFLNMIVITSLSFLATTYYHIDKESKHIQCKEWVLVFNSEVQAVNWIFVS